VGHIEEQDFTRAANDPAIKAAVRRLQERYPAAYFGQVDLEELVGIAVWEARPVIQRKYESELARLKARLDAVREVVESSPDDELKAKLRELLES
jgi:hypothetical protein